VGLIDRARNSTHPQEMVKGYIFLAQCHALERCIVMTAVHQAAKDQCVTLKEEAERALARATEIMTRYPSSTSALQPEVDATGTMLRELVFYSTVSAHEMRAVYQAMGLATGTRARTATRLRLATAACQWRRQGVRSVVQWSVDRTTRQWLELCARMRWRQLGLAWDDWIWATNDDLRD
jgi:hypothetical protein